MAVKRTRATRNDPITAARRGESFVGTVSESAAWTEVERSAKSLDTLARDTTNVTVRGKLQQAATVLHHHARVMLQQLKADVHQNAPRRNAPLTVLSLVNPPKGGHLMSDRLFTIEYKHKGNGKNYFHDFEPGTQMHAMPDGSIRISRPGAKVWGDYPSE